MSRGDIAYETTRFRCRTCHKLLALDVGGNTYGDVDGQLFCFNCGPIPQPSDYEIANTRAAIAAVTRSTP